jgi:hypothetical protein
MSDPLHATPIDGQDAVALLNASVPVGWAPRQHLVDLQQESLQLSLTLYRSLVKVKVTLLPTTSRSVHLGFEPRLGLMTRC